jgi:protein SCO1
MLHQYYMQLPLQKFMKKKIFIYIGFFAVLLTGFYIMVFRDYDFSKSNLPIRIVNVDNFSFTNQDGKRINTSDVSGKVYVAEYFFTTCRGICPIMNANMRRVYDAFKDEPGFAILSHTCMPETDSVPLLKAYERKMLTGKVTQIADGSYTLIEDSAAVMPQNKNWFFLTGDKADLYKMARLSYGIDNGKPDSTQLIKDQFIHTQFFALIDKQGTVRGGAYDGLNNEEIDKLITDIKGLLKERVAARRFMDGFNNTPN